MAKGTAVVNKKKVRIDKYRVRLRAGEYQLDNGRYVYRWRESDGKRPAVYADNLQELREKEEQISADKHDKIRTNVKSITINDMFDLWRKLKRGIKDSTLKNYIYMYETFVKPNFGKSRITEVRKSDVRGFYNNLIDGKTMKMSTVDVIHNILHQVFQVAVDDDMIRGNPTDGMLRELKLSHLSNSQKKEALTVDQEKIFLEFLLHSNLYNHWYPVFYTMANTGMRVGEITGLRWCDVNFKEGFIDVNHTLVYYNHQDERGCCFSINTPKTKSGERRIPMSEGVKKALLMEKQIQEDFMIQSVSEIDGYSDFVFVNRFGEVRHQGNLNRALQRIVRDCNCEILENCEDESDPVLLPHFTCHILRHTFATRLCESGLNIKVIQACLGHTDISTTMDIYVSVTDDLKKKEFDIYTQYLSKQTDDAIEL